MASPRMATVAMLCLAASLLLQVDARVLTSPSRDLLASLNNGCNGGSPTCYTSGGAAGYCCPEGYNCFASDKFACYAASGSYPSQPDLIVGENVAGGGVSSGNSIFPSDSDPQCKNTPGRNNPCFSADGSVNVCCSNACGPLTKQGYPTCSGQCSGPTQLLYVWAGVSSDGAASNARDYVGVVSIDRNNQYGKLLYRAEIPYAGTEAHHMGQSPDNKFLVAGGVFSSVQGLPQVFFYDIADDPYHPLYTGDIDPKNSGITDQVVFDSQGRAIITQMGSYTGGTPGRLLEVTPPFPTDLASGLKPAFAEYGAGGPGEDTMNPHGLDVNADSTIAITGDFIEPVSLFASSPDQIKFRDTLRIWRRNVNGNAGWTNTRTFVIPGAGGVQDVEFIPGDAKQRAFATLVNGNGLALVNPTDETVKVVYNFGNETCIPHVADVSNDGKRFFVSCIGLGQVWMLDISNPEAPLKLDAKDCGGPASNPHFVRLSPDNDRLFVSNYFVTAGLASNPGARTVLSFNVKATSLEADTAFGSLSFGAVVDDNGVVTNSRPHGMTVNYLSC